MPVHVGKITSEVTVIDGDMPLTEAQIEKLVRLVMKKMQERAQQTQASEEERKLRRASLPPSSVQD